MDKGHIEKLRRLVELFEARDQLHQHATERILEEIGETVLAALYELFGTSYENVSWLDVQLVDNIVMLVVTVAYPDGQNAPQIVQNLSPIEINQEGMASVRLFRIGIPVQHVYKSKDDLVQFFISQIQKYMKSNEETVETTPEESKVDDKGENSVPVQPTPNFDTSQLTREQAEALLLLRHTTTTGTKH